MANELAKAAPTELSAKSEMFTDEVLRQFGQVSPGEFRISDYQRQLVMGYFIEIDKALKDAEEKRVSENGWKNVKNEDPVNWNTVDLTALALDVMHYARMGLDMTQKNMLFAIPYKDNSRKCRGGTAVYVVNLMQGYNGIRYIAENYALEKPKAVTVELVYSTDVFRPIKKGRGNGVESYEFEITSPFDRGKVAGGFGYIEYEDPSKNRLVLMSRRDMEKRIPKKASANFWGSEATGRKVTEWDGGKKAQVETEGWFEEMCLKTLKREVYSPKHIPVDPKRVDDSYQHMKQQELRLARMEARSVAEEQAASIVVDIPGVGELGDRQLLEQQGTAPADSPAEAPAEEPAPAAEVGGTGQMVLAGMGPGF